MIGSLILVILKSVMATPLKSEVYIKNLRFSVIFFMFGFRNVFTLTVFYYFKHIF